MNRTANTPATYRVLTAVILATLWLAAAAGGFAAEAPAKPAETPASATQTVGKLTLNGAKYEGEIRDGKAAAGDLSVRQSRQHARSLRRRNPT